VVRDGEERGREVDAIEDGGRHPRSRCRGGPPRGVLEDGLLRPAGSRPPQSGRHRLGADPERLPAREHWLPPKSPRRLSVLRRRDREAGEISIGG
jgi:hypothetical protein